MAKKLIPPDTGHLIQFHFDVPPGSNAPSTRPALVLSPLAYNQRTGLVVVCAISAQGKGYPFEVPFGNAGQVILADQVKSLNWKDTRISHAGRVDAGVLSRVRQRLQSLLFAPNAGQ